MQHDAHCFVRVGRLYNWRGRIVRIDRAMKFGVYVQLRSGATQRYMLKEIDHD